MNILALQGSPRKKGNTATILGLMKDEFSSLGHEVTTISIQDKTIKGCLACGKCKQIQESVGCIQDDDAIPILEQMTRSDLVIYASPLYFWGLAGPLKTLIDRTYSLYTAYHQPEHASLVEGQRHALLMTGGGPFDNNAEFVFNAFSKLQKPHKAIHAGELYIGGCKPDEELSADAQQQARSFARKLVA